MRLGLIGGALNRSDIKGIYSPSDNVELQRTLGELDTFVFSNKNGYIGGVSANYYGMHISEDGQYLYLADLTAGGTSIDRWTLSTPFDISTATYSEAITTLATTITDANEGSPTGVFINSEGDRLMFVGSGRDAVYNYFLPSKFTFSGYRYGNIRTRQVTGTNGSGFDTGIHGMTFGNNGLKLYVVGVSLDIIFQWDLTTAWDISTATYSNKSLSVTARETQPRALSLSSDGTKAYVVGDINRNVIQYNLSTPWDISTGTFSASFSINAQDTSPQGMYFKPDGTKMYISGNTNDRIYQYTLATAWSISTASYDNVSFYVGGGDLSPLGVAFSSDGTKMYIAGDSGNNIVYYTLSSAWNISTAAYSAVTNVGNSPLSLTGLVDIEISSDGNYIYILDSSYGIKQFDLMIPYVSTSANLGWFSVSTATAPNGIFFGDNGYKMYIADDTNDRIYQWDLTVPWIPTQGTATLNANSLFIGSQETLIGGLCFNKNGDKMFIVGVSNDTVYQYNLSTPWQVSTGTYSGKFLNVSIQDSAPRDIACSSLTDKIYVLGETNDRIYQYSAVI